MSSGIEAIEIKHFPLHDTILGLWLTLKIQIRNTYIDTWVN